MKRQEFIDAVYDCGWIPRGDAQHEQINQLWDKLFPTASAYEDEMTDLYKALENQTQTDEAGV